jgi:hypothetical protein
MQDTDGLKDQLDESWNASIEALRKSAGVEPMEKAFPPAKGKEPPQDTKADAEEDAEDEDEDEEGEEEGDESEGGKEPEGKMPPQFAKKSMEDMMEDDPEAVSAMDVEPFLRQFVKAFDIAMANVLTKVNRVEKMAKAQAEVIVRTAELQKSTSDVIYKIGGQPIRSGTVLAKANGNGRFEKSEKALDPRDFETATHQLLMKGQMGLQEVTLANIKAKRGTFNPEGDNFDRKVQALIDANSKGGNG